MIRIYIMLCTVALALLFGSCESNTAAEANSKLTHESSADGLHVSLSVSSDKITTSEMLLVELIVKSDESMKVKLPESTGKWGDFAIFESRTIPAKLGGDDRVVQGVVYTLEPDVSGESSLTGLVVKAVDGDGEEVELSTAPVSVKVVSVLNSGENKMRDIAPNERVNVEGQTPRWIIALFGSNIVLVLGVVVVWLTWKKKQVVVSDHLHVDFENLRSVPATEVMSRIERVVCLALAKQRNITLSKVDFAGLHQALEIGGTTIVGLAEAIAQYEKLQYASQAVDEGQVRALHGRFGAIIFEKGKDMAS
jgi:hypothetical protein